MSQEIGNVIAGLYEPYNYEAITVADSAIGFTASILKDNSAPLKDCQRVICTLETASVRYTTDGTTPTTTIGHLLNAGDIVIVQGQPAISNFRAIRTGGTSGSLKCTFER